MMVTKKKEGRAWSAKSRAKASASAKGRAKAPEHRAKLKENVAVQGFLTRVGGWVDKSKEQWKDAVVHDGTVYFLLQGKGGTVPYFKFLAMAAFKTHRDLYDRAVAQVLAEDEERLERTKRTSESAVRYLEQRALTDDENFDEQ